jgi:uncharacterized membrane protein
VRRLRKYLMAGLAVTLPTVVTAWLLWKIVNGVDNILDPLQRRLFGFDVPLLGFLVVVLLLIIAGSVAGNFVGRRLLHFYQVLVTRVPLAGKIYRAVQQILDVFVRDNTQSFKSVVSFEYPRRGIWALGFVSGVTPPGWTQADGGERLLNVFIPTSPNPTSGFLLLVPERELRILDLSVEDALKVIISGGAYVPGPLSVPPVTRPAPEPRP